MERYTVSQVAELTGVTVRTPAPLRRGRAAPTRVLDDPDHDPLETLHFQRKSLMERSDQLAAAISNIDQAIQRRRTGLDMTDDQIRDIFDGFDPKAHQAEAEERGGKEHVRQTMTRAGR